MLYFQDFILASKKLFQQIWLSITSPNFYYDVYKHYKGYGIKYILTLSFISSLLHCIIIFSYLVNFKNYFLFDKVTSSTRSINYIFNQLPTISFNGNYISLEENEPFYLYDIKKNKIGVIDTEGKLSYLKREETPFVLTKNKINFSLINNNNFSIEYKKLFGTDERILTLDIIKKALGNLLSSGITGFIFLGPAFFIILHFITHIIENIFIILLIYVLCKSHSLKPSFKTSIRLAMFASGASLLLETIVALGIPELSRLMWLFSLWPMVIMFLGLNKIREEQYI